MNIKWDAWQAEVLAYQGNKVICSGRQQGKSSVEAADAGEFATKNKGTNTLIISVTEDQAKELLLKVVLYLEDNYKAYIKKPYSKNVLKDLVRLNNGSTIRTKAVGQGGVGARGFTIHKLIADEAAFMPDDVWAAVTPMLLTTGGTITLLSTPHGKRGYFFDCYHDPNFKTWHINAVENTANRAISPTWTQFQHDKAMEFLESEKRRMSEREFGQEYLGLFLEDLGQFFPDDTIRKAMIQQRSVGIGEDRDYFLGVDVARMGDDKCTFEIIERRDELLIHRESIVWRKILLNEVSEKIKMLDAHWGFRKIYIDDGGIGVGVFDTIYSTPGFKKRTVAINNAQRVYGYNPNGTPTMKKLLKEDLYNNLLMLMEKGKILILDDGDIWQSFKTVQYEYLNQKGGAMMRIFGDDTHIVEGLIRAAWCYREKINKFAISYI